MKKALLPLCLLLALSGCSPVGEAPPAPLPIKTAAPSPSPRALSQDEACRALEELWDEELEIDVSVFLPLNMFDPDSPWRIFGVPETERQWLPAMEEGVQEQISLAAQKAVLAFGQGYGTEPAWEFQITGPSWQLLCALLQGCTDLPQANEVIRQAVVLAVEPKTAGPDSPAFALCAAPLPYREALRLPGGDEGAFLSRCFSYSYLYTVYGGDGSEIEYELPPGEGSLAAGIRWPLGGHIRLRKTWYADRDGGRRKHTGTDIWAKADTEIYSCTEGTVTYVGEGTGTGYAVVVTDPYGYEFHYYHMIRLSDFLRAGEALKAGALIGHVGNTGNSSRDHLHLTIVAPDGKYINPYPYLKAVEP